MIINIDKIKIQHRQIIATITDRILKFEAMIKKPLVTNYTFFTDISFSRISSFAYIFLSQYNIYKINLSKSRN